MRSIASLIWVFFSSLVFAQDFYYSYGIIPKPYYTMIKGDTFSMKNTQFIGVCNDSFYSLDYVKKIMSSNDNSTKYTRIDLEIDSSEAARDAYKMRIFKNDIIIKAGRVGGYYALQTLKQLDDNGTLMVGEIIDGPVYKYRGMHLDVSRHFFQVDELKKYIDKLSRYKFNHLHLHLTDDQGWRIEIKKYPKLTDIGSVRKRTVIGRQRADGKNSYDNNKVQGFYTQEQLREILRYAEERFVNIVPEIDMPGHMQAAIASYPHLSCTGKAVEVGDRWGVYQNVLCPCQENTYKFVEDVLDEVMDLFPSKYVHIGGDEVIKSTWESALQCRRLMKKEGIKTMDELQSYFIRRIETHVNKRGKTIIGWDEILEGGLAPNATVMSWRGEKGGMEAARAKHDVIMTPGEPLYFDHGYSKSKEEPLNIGGANTLQEVYNYNPNPFELGDSATKFILGAQANVWTEYIADWTKLEYMVFPRMQALSEALWLPTNIKNINDFYARLAIEMDYLDREGVHYRIPEPIGYKDTINGDSAVAISLIPISKKHELDITLDGKPLVLRNHMTVLEPKKRDRRIRIVVSNGKRKSIPYYMVIKKSFQK